MRKRISLILALLITVMLIFASCRAKPSTESSIPVSPSVSESDIITSSDTGSEAESEEISSGISSSYISSDISEVSDISSKIEEMLDKDGFYYSKDEVALYIHQYGKLPSNFITKKEAKALGWSGGSLEKYAPGYVIGGDKFGNYEGLLPDGHTYYECDIDTLGQKKRGAKRIIFSSDGLIYYTEDHYDSFTLLYGKE